MKKFLSAVGKGLGKGLWFVGNMLALLCEVLMWVIGTILKYAALAVWRILQLVWWIVKSVAKLVGWVLKGVVDFLESDTSSYLYIIICLILVARHAYEHQPYLMALDAILMFGMYMNLIVSLIRRKIKKEESVVLNMHIEGSIDSLKVD